MEVQIKTKDFKVSQGLREYVQERVDKLDRFVGRGANAKLELTHEHIKPAPEMNGNIDGNFITGIGSVGERMLILMDIEGLMSSAEMGLMGGHA